jgi:acyl carrier protein
MDIPTPLQLDVKSAVRDYIVRNFLMGGTLAIEDGDSFVDHHVVDSTGFLELVTFLEERWGLVVEDEEMLPENLDSLAGMEAYVRRKLAE